MNQPLCIGWWVITLNWWIIMWSVDLPLEPPFGKRTHLVSRHTCICKHVCIDLHIPRYWLAHVSPMGWCGQASVESQPRQWWCYSLAVLGWWRGTKPRSCRSPLLNVQKVIRLKGHVHQQLCTKEPQCWVLSKPFRIVRKHGPNGKLTQPLMGGLEEHSNEFWRWTTPAISYSSRTSVM